MIECLLIVQSGSYDAHYNQAVEAALMDMAAHSPLDLSEPSKPADLVKSSDSSDDSIYSFNSAFNMAGSPHSLLDLAALVNSPDSLNSLNLTVISAVDSPAKNPADLPDGLWRRTVILYLWANDGAVFIGKNQNAYLECNLEALKTDGGTLCRRITGGGAVYHDKGNLNYSFIAPRNIYDEEKQFDIVLRAVRSLGFDAHLSGRNDILIEGKKFSGNAFFRGLEVGLHHGTLLIKSDYNSIAKYLSVSKIKLSGNGVSSISSRIINLSEIVPDVSKEQIAQALIKAAALEYKTPPLVYDLSRLDKQNLNKWRDFLTDEKRLYGDNIFYDARIEHRFDWGTSDIRLKLNKNIIVAARIYSDGLNTGLIKSKEEALIGQDIYNITDESVREIIEKIDMD